MNDDELINHSDFNPANGVPMAGAVDIMGNSLGHNNMFIGHGVPDDWSCDDEAIQVLPIWIKLAHYAALASVFAFIFWMMFERGIL